MAQAERGPVWQQAAYKVELQSWTKPSELDRLSVLGTSPESGPHPLHSPRQRMDLFSKGHCVIGSTSPRPLKGRLSEGSIHEHMQVLVRSASHAFNFSSLGLMSKEVAVEEQVDRSPRQSGNEAFQIRRQQKRSSPTGEAEDFDSPRKSMRVGCKGCSRGDTWDGLVPVLTQQAVAGPAPGGGMKRLASGELKRTSSADCCGVAKAQRETAATTQGKVQRSLSEISGENRRSIGNAVENSEKQTSRTVTGEPGGAESCRRQKTSGPAPDEPIVCQVACQSWAGRKNGVRKANQDAYFFMRSHDRRCLLFGVFDGHGPNGQEASTFVKDNLPLCLMEQPTLLTSPEDAFKKAFPRVNDDLEPGVECSVSGTTAVVAQLYRRRLTVAWAGDSRAVLARCKEGGVLEALPLTEDHKPDIAAERQRIVENYGRVDRLRDQHGEAVGPYRVWLGEAQVLGLAMSRSLGDGLAHSVGVISEPEVRSHELQEADKFLILASDGVWEWISSEEAVQIVGSAPSLEAGCKKLMLAAKSRWRRFDMGTYMDDITAMVIGFTRRAVETPSKADNNEAAAAQLPPGPAPVHEEKQVQPQTRHSISLANSAESTIGSAHQHSVPVPDTGSPCRYSVTSLDPAVVARSQSHAADSTLECAQSAGGIKVPSPPLTPLSTLEISSSGEP